MPLEEYRRKRDFSTTPEPTGGKAAARGALTFVVHKHASRALHYDLRLEVDGVYASWAVPKGPSLDTHDKHLAVHVEDHPLEYGSFEGVIPAGEYGAGTVMIWDRGIFTPVDDPTAGIAKGDFKFVLEGSKLHGQWVLVRMKPRPGDKRENWLLIKERDEHVRPHAEYDVLAAEPDSAATGRTMEEITAAGADPPKPAGGAAGADPLLLAAVAADPPEADDPPLRLGGVIITNPEKRLEPAGITKADLARYYEQVSSWMLPHIAGRPLTIVRCPHGEPGAEGCFYQKHPEARGWPDTFKTVTIQDSGGPAVYFYVEDEAGLLSLAQLGTLEIHVWNSLASDPERPDRIIFDLDPGPGVDFAGVVDAARTVRDSLDALGLTAFLKTTGGHGLHVVTPIVPDRTYDDVRDFAHALVSLLGARRPDLFVAVMAKVQRPGRVFIDYLRNAHGATAVCAYSTRARPGAHVSVPLTWEGVGRADPSAYDVTTVPRRLAALRKDPWDGYEHARRALSGDMIAVVGAGKE